MPSSSPNKNDNKSSKAVYSANANTTSLSSTTSLLHEQKKKKENQASSSPADKAGTSSRNDSKSLTLQSGTSGTGGSAQKSGKSEATLAAEEKMIKDALAI